MSSTGTTSATHAGPAAGADPRWRPWLAAVALTMMVAGLVPPVATLAGRYVVAETAQFLAFAVVIPALLVLGRPWSRRGLAGLAGPAGRLAAAWRRHPSFLRPVAVLVVFGLLVVVWRLPAVVDAVARHPGLAVAELASVLMAGTALWLEIGAAPPGRPRRSDLARAVIATFAMWLIWVIAYILGFANHGVFHAFRYVPGGPLGAVADQELATGLMWLVAGACFMPVIFSAAIGWLRDNEDVDAELGRAASATALPAVRGWGQPHRGKSSSS